MRILTTWLEMCKKATTNKKSGEHIQKNTTKKSYRSNIKKLDSVINIYYNYYC